MTELVSLTTPVHEWSTSSVSHVASGVLAPLGRMRGRALVIEAGHSEADTCARALRALHLECSWMPRGLEGLAAARSTPFDLCFVDLELPDVSGIDVVRTLRAESDVDVIVLRAAVGTTSAATGGVGAANRDVTSYLDKPFRSTDVIAIVNSLIGSQGVRRPAARQPEQDNAPGCATSAPNNLARLSAVINARSVAERWACLVLRTIDEDSDPKTITIWAKAVGVSRSVLCECCRLVHVPAHDARDFARLLRAVCCSGEQWQPEAVLDLADERTLKKLLARGGFGPHIRRTPNIPEFLKQQRWISDDNPGLAALRALLFDPARYVSR